MPNMGQALQTFLFIMKMILYILRLFVAVYIQSGNVNDLLYCMSGSLPISCLFLKDLERVEHTSWDAVNTESASL